MRPAILALILFGIMPSAAPAAGLVEAGELEHARANARAGGPLSERDKELLDRWGCLSGTRNSFCTERERYHSGERARTRTERRARRH